MTSAAAAVSPSSGRGRAEILHGSLVAQDGKRLYKGEGQGATQGAHIQQLWAKNRASQLN